MEKETLICIVDGIKISFFYYEIPLLFEKLDFKGIKIADYRDILAEKIKTTSQRGSKKDFYDIYSIFKKIEISEGIKIFKEKFADKDINYYHVLKNLTYFEDAENEPSVIALNKPYSWNEVKKFFIKNIREFEKEMMKA